MKSSFQLGRVLGIPIGVNYTWFIIFALITVSLAMAYFPENYPFWSQRTYWLMGLVASLLFFGSVIAHELAHSAVAISSGIPVKSITLFVFGGVAQITREASKPRTELVMSLAGPLSSLLLAGLFFVISLATLYLSKPLSAIAGWLATINLVLALFNLIPGFPLDGGRVLRSIIWWTTNNYRLASRIASIIGQGVSYLFIIVGIFTMFRGEWLNGLWLAFIGWFLDNAAGQSYRQVVLQDALRGYTARDLMTRDCPTVGGGQSLSQLVHDHILPAGRRCFLVTDGDRLTGIVTLHNVRTVQRDHWDETPVSRVMTPVEQLKSVQPTDEVLTILQRMDEEDVNQMPVVEGGVVVGMIGRDSLLHFLRTRSELGI